MNKIYILSGLGVDERVFKRIDFSGLDITFIKWISPNKGETIESYASRLIGQIHKKKPILIGLSFGGIMVTEIAKQIETEKIILIASAKTKYEIPFYYRLVGFLKLNKLLPAKFLAKPNFISDWFFGVKNKEDRTLLAQILRDTDTTFLAWAIDKIVNWKNTIEHQNTQHIHGTADRILPIRFVKPDIIIPKGGHFMTVNKYKELTKILRDGLALP